MSSAPAIQADTRVRVAPNVYARAFGDELVLLEFGRGEYFGLDVVGAAIWRGLEQGETLAEIADGIVRRWEVTKEDALRDVEALVSHMQREALVVLPP